MTGIGVHFALTAQEGMYIRSLADQQARVEYLHQVIEETYFGEFPELVAESGEAWEAMHLVLSGGDASSADGADPLGHVVLGGETLYADEGYVITLKSPQLVRQIAAALPRITQEEFRRRYFAIDPQSYGSPLTEEECDWIWDCFQEVAEVYTRAAQQGRFVLFELQGEETAEESSQYPSFFRDFGILPLGTVPPVGKVRCFISSARIAFEYSVTLIMAAVGVGLMVFLVRSLPQPLNWLGGMSALVAFGAFIYLGTNYVYRWIELEDNILRVQYLITGRTLERSIEEIQRVDTLIGQLRQAETAVIDALLGRVRGVEIRFQNDYLPLHIVRVMRADPVMIHGEELIQALYCRMSQIGELETKLVDIDGVPMVGNVHWKGKEPGTPTPGNIYVVLGCAAIGLGLLVGTIMGFEAGAALEREAICSVPPQVIPLADLIQNGPGKNRHVTITDFRPGNHIVLTNDNRWTDVWVPLFPIGKKPNAIEMMLSADTIRDEGALDLLLQQQQITGICSADKRSSWGSTLGPQLVEANQNLPLSSAWVIEDTTEPPDSTGSMRGSTICFGLVVVIAAFVVWKSA